MANTPHNPNRPDQQPTRLPDGLSRAALLRAIADGEQAPGSAQADASEGAEQAIEFERELRDAVSRAMREPAQAPAGLREQILARFDAEHAADDRPISFTEHKQQAERNPSALFSILPRFGAIAAVLLLSAAALWMGVQQFSGSGPSDVQTANLQTVSSQLHFVQREHNRCSDIASGNFTSKIVATGVEEARAFAESQLGCGGARLAEAIARMDDAGYAFVGVGACAVPGGGKSIHALFNPHADRSDSLSPVSVFLLESPGEGCKDAKPGICYSCPKAKESGKPAMLWRDENLIVFVHSDSEQSVENARAAYMAPEPVESL
jgi:hypothetical protein